MLPLHHFGKARQAELLKLVEQAPEALEQENYRQELADVVKSTLLDATEKQGRTALAIEARDSSESRPLKQSFWSKLLRLFGKYGQAT